MSKTLTVILSLCLFVFGVSSVTEAQVRAISTPVSGAAGENDRAQDGLNGPVRRVRLETAQILVKDGKAVEGSRQLRGIATYDPKGRKIDAVAFPVDGDSLTGKERYRYDDKGNIIEMEVRDSDGSILSKETYRYEFDPLGNWKKMTTSVSLYENGTVSDEPIEVSYRTIAYYYGAIEKLESGVRPSESRLITPDSGAAASSAPANAPVAPTASDNQVKNAVLKDPLPAVQTPLENKQPEPAAVTSVATIKPDPPSTGDASNQPVMAKLGDESRLAANVPAQSEKIAPQTFPAAASNDHAEVMTPRRDETSSSTALYETGLTYLGAGSYDEAIGSFNQLIRVNPRDAMAHAKLGLAYSGLRRFREAIVVLNTAIRMKPEVVDARAYYYLGYSYSQLGLYTEAVAAFNKALYATRQEAVDNEDANGQSVPAAQIYYELGVAHYGMKRHAEAIKELNEALKLNPRFAEAYYGLALAYLARGDRWSARKQQKPLVSLNAALAKKLADEISSSNFGENIPCASSGFCR